MALTEWEKRKDSISEETIVSLSHWEHLVTCFVWKGDKRDDWERDEREEGESSISRVHGKTKQTPWLVLWLWRRQQKNMNEKNRITVTVVIVVVTESHKKATTFLSDSALPLCLTLSSPPIRSSGHRVLASQVIRFWNDDSGKGDWKLVYFLFLNGREKRIHSMSHDW